MARSIGTDVIEGWPGELKHVRFETPGPKLPSAIRYTLESIGLPQLFCFSNDFKFDFTIGTTQATHLSRQWFENVDNEDFPQVLDLYWTIGESALEGAFHWLCIESGSGRIVYVGWENEPRVYHLHSSPLSLLRTMLAILNWHDEYGGTEHDCEDLKRDISRYETDPRFWLYVVDHFLVQNSFARVGTSEFDESPLPRVVKNRKVTRKVTRKRK